jgi:hypothetical protein
MGYTMPGYFRFTRIGDETNTAVKFNDIDNEMRVFFGAPEDPLKYFCGWYDIIGEALAMGSNLPAIRDIFRDKCQDEMGVKITEWLMANFTTDAWYSRVK